MDKYPSNDQIADYIKGASKLSRQKIFNNVFDCKRHEFAGCSICNTAIHPDLKKTVTQCKSCGMIIPKKKAYNCNDKGCTFVTCEDCKPKYFNHSFCNDCFLQVFRCEFCRQCPKKFIHDKCEKHNMIIPSSPKSARGPPKTPLDDMMLVRPSTSSPRHATVIDTYKKSRTKKYPNSDRSSGRSTNMMNRIPRRMESGRRSARTKTRHVSCPDPNSTISQIEKPNTTTKPLISIIHQGNKIKK